LIFFENGLWTYFALYPIDMCDLIFLFALMNYFQWWVDNFTSASSNKNVSFQCTNYDFSEKFLFSLLLFFRSNYILFWMKQTFESLCHIRKTFVLSASLNTYFFFFLAFSFWPFFLFFAFPIINWTHQYYSETLQEISRVRLEGVFPVVSHVRNNQPKKNHSNYGFSSTFHVNHWNDMMETARW
jgi:hypothetical protein